MRGLDYYRHTAFEFVTDRLGAQGTVLGGGRYDGLIETLGGAHTPAVGWAAGIERLAMLVGDAGIIGVNLPLVCVIADHSSSLEDADLIRRRLRTAGIAVYTSYRGNIKRQIEIAHKQEANALIFVREGKKIRISAPVPNATDIGVLFSTIESSIGADFEIIAEL